MGKEKETYSEMDLKHASELRDWVHEEVLEKARAVYPDIKGVVDPYPVESYFQKMWDYPGAWYTIVAVPEGYKSRKALVDTLVKMTIAYYEKDLK